MRRSPVRPAVLCVSWLLAVLAGGPRALAADPAALPKASGLVLDGKLSEEAWGSAAVLETAPVAVPARRGQEPQGTLSAEIRPEVRVLVADGHLWIGVRIPEDVGLGTGLKGMVAWPETKGAPDAFAFAFMPQDVRSARYVVRGPRGVGRAVYGVRGALDLSDPSGVRMEVSVPVADLAPPAPDAVLRLALAVNTRTPEALAWAPPSAKLAGPEAWSSWKAPEGGWPADGAVDRAALAAEDARDEARMVAWRKFLEGRQKPPQPGPPEQVFGTLKQNVLDPLDEVLSHRPDLAYAHAIKADVYQKVGKPAEAVAEASAALRAAPGLREALFVLAVAFSEERTSARPDQPSDYAAAFARLDAAEAEAKDAQAKDGIALGRGLLLFKHGDFAEARALLEPLAGHYPFFPPAVEHAEQARAYAEHWPAERQFRAADEKRGDLPRAGIRTPLGTVVVELFEDDAPNTVKNFVWLAEHGFYDGTTFHRNVPFFVAQGGDPYSKDPAKAAMAGAGGPGYSIRTEPSKRKPFRGVIAMARSSKRDTEGSQFFLTTGTAANLEGDYSVFGRIVEGQDVAERLVKDVRIERVEVLRKRPGTTYRPLTTGGDPAPEPR